MPKLCINIDHVATVREARKTTEPDPLIAARLAIEGGADGITVHLREDRRHIKDRDVLLLSSELRLQTSGFSALSSQLSARRFILFTLEMAATNEMLEIASKVKPGLVTLVPEKRQELTTEGGLDVISQRKYLTDYLNELHKNGLTVSIFINANKEQIKAAKNINADFIEVHTGPYANNSNHKELELVREAIEYGQKLGLKTNAGHGLNYENVKPIVEINGIEQLHIGHSVIARAVMVGIKEAVKEMKTIVRVAGKGGLKIKV